MSCAPDRLTPDRTLLVGRIWWVSRIANVPDLHAAVVMRYLEHRYLVYYQFTTCSQYEVTNQRRRDGGFVQRAADGVQQRHEVRRCMRRARPGGLGPCPAMAEGTKCFH
jgi:hypothetical protein